MIKQLMVMQENILIFKSYILVCLGDMERHVCYLISSGSGVKEFFVLFLQISVKFEIFVSRNVFKKRNILKFFSASLSL